MQIPAAAQVTTAPRLQRVTVDDRCRDCHGTPKKMGLELSRVAARHQADMVRIPWWVLTGDPDRWFLHILKATNSKSIPFFLSTASASSCYERSFLSKLLCVDSRIFSSNGNSGPHWRRALDKKNQRMASSSTLYPHQTSQYIILHPYITIKPLDFPPFLMMTSPKKRHLRLGQAEVTTISSVAAAQEKVVPHGSAGYFQYQWFLTLRSVVTIVNGVYKPSQLQLNIIPKLGICPLV